MFMLGDIVRINTPDNPRLHNTQAEVLELTEWGAHLDAPAAATGRFRALYEEMVSTRKATAPTKKKEDGYTGDICIHCNGSRMRRTGSCLTCEDCGDNSGCG